VADRDGFTVIELLVALALAGIVVVSLFEFISGQGRFVELQGAREEVQQNTRAALDLMGSELRTLPEGDALVVAASDEITFRAARVWGVVCSGSGSTLDVAFPSVTGATYTVNGGTGVIVNLGTAAVPIWSGAVAINANGIGAAQTTCGGSALPAGVERRTLTLAATPQNGAATPVAGNVLYIYDQVSYRIGTSAGVPGQWILRQIGAGNNQPMAGPVTDGGSGLSFAYYASGSSTPIVTPILTVAGRAAVSKIAVMVESVSRNSLGETQETKADTVIVPLRNRV
jgi:prepilin-type N-terminal cleavage/methylation domain-containing protein